MGNKGPNLAHRYKRCYEEIALQETDPWAWSAHILLSEFVGDTTDLTILDIGSGSGQLLAKLGANGIALDISENALSNAKVRGLAAVVANAERLPFAERSFHVIVAASVLEHVLDVDAVVREMHRVVRQCGRAYVLIPFREDVSVYAESPYEFVHVRSFDWNSIGETLHCFDVLRKKHIQYMTFRPLYLLRKIVKSIFPSTYGRLKKSIRTRQRLQRPFSGDLGNDIRPPVRRQILHLLNYCPHWIVGLLWKPYAVMLEMQPRTRSECDGLPASQREANPMAHCKWV